MKRSSPAYGRKLMTRDLAILAMDADMLPHAEIGRCFNITKERVRQICQKAGRPDRTTRLIGQRQTHFEQMTAARAERKAQKAERVVEMERLWNLGATFEDIAAAWGFDPPTYRRGAALIHYLRLTHPERAFSVRSPNNWSHRARVERNA